MDPSWRGRLLASAGARPSGCSGWFLGAGVALFFYYITMFLGSFSSTRRTAFDFILALSPFVAPLFAPLFALARGAAVARTWDLAGSGLRSTPVPGTELADAFAELVVAPLRALARGFVAGGMILALFGAMSGCVDPPPLPDAFIAPFLASLPLWLWTFQALPAYAVWGAWIGLDPERSAQRTAFAIGSLVAAAIGIPVFCLLGIVFSYALEAAQRGAFPAAILLSSAAVLLGVANATHSLHRRLLARFVRDWDGGEVGP